MRRMILGAIVVGACALPATANAKPQFWGGPIEDLPHSTVTYKVNSHGAVKNIRVKVKMKCRQEGGRPAHDGRLITGFLEPKMTQSGFRDKYRVRYDGDYGIKQKIKADVIGSTASGFFHASSRSSQASAHTRICHSGKQHWRATPLSFSEWQDLRDFH